MGRAKSLPSPRALGSYDRQRGLDYSARAVLTPGDKLVATNAHRPTRKRALGGILCSGRTRMETPGADAIGKETMKIEWSIESGAHPALRMEALIDTLLPYEWQRRCVIEMSDEAPLCRVHTGGPEKRWLRYSGGPSQGTSWDVYGDEFLYPELAIVALSQAMPPGKKIHREWWAPCNRSTWWNAEQMRRYGDRTDRREADHGETNQP